MPAVGKMALNLTPDAQAALDLAKRVMGPGAELDAGLLLAALYHGGALREQLPQYLAAYLDRPRPLRADSPEQVAVAEDLKPILARFTKLGPPATSLDLFRDLARSVPGQAFLAAKGMPAHELTGLLETLDGLSASENPAPSQPPTWQISPKRRAAIDTLGSFGRMLTASEPPQRGVHRGGSLDRAIHGLVVALSAFKNRSAVLVGAPGTGKSAAVYELARRLYRGDASLPVHLRDLDLFELSPIFLRSGASMVGQYEERVKTLLQTLEANPKIVLFVDEIHSLLRGGLNGHDPFSDANEALKAPLAAGRIACIGCTTPAEYHRDIEPDRAMRDRFQFIRLDEPGIAETLAILEAKRPLMETYFAPLRLPGAILERIVDLAGQYLTDRAQPRKSLQLLDRACATAVTRDPPLVELTEEAVWQALEDIIGHSPARTATLTEADLFARLRARILGQDETLRGIARAFLAGIGGWAKHDGPRGVWFFAGPTGVGKTETALLLAQILGGDREALVRIDCNTLQGAGHDSTAATNVLLGPPPGFIGYVRGEGGALSRVRDRPECIVLFDEIEKADPGVAKLLLQILDTGRVEDNDGNTLDFRRAFVVFTSNAGVCYEAHRAPTFEATYTPTTTPSADLDAVKAELRALGYGEEFFGRVGHWFRFQGLSAKTSRQVIAQQLGKLKDSADVRGFALDWEPAVVERLASAWQPRFGVRHLLAILHNRIVEQLAVAEAQGDLAGVRCIRLRVLAVGTSAPNQDLTGLANRRREGDELWIELA